MGGASIAGSISSAELPLYSYSEEERKSFNRLPVRKNLIKIKQNQMKSLPKKKRKTSQNLLIFHCFEHRFFWYLSIYYPNDYKREILNCLSIFRQVRTNLSCDVHSVNYSF